MNFVSFDQVELLQATSIHEARGRITIHEEGNGFPFIPKRCYVIQNVPQHIVRGRHAHKSCSQLLTCLQGSLTCQLDNGDEKREFFLDDPATSLLIPPLIWAEQYNFSPNAILQVFASEPYDPDEYIEDYAQFLQQVKNS